MTDAEFRSWLATEVAAGRMSSAQRDDLLKQKELFDGDFRAEDSPLRHSPTPHRRLCSRRQAVCSAIHHLIDGAKRDFPDRMIYFEPIEFDLF